MSNIENMRGMLGTAKTWRVVVDGNGAYRLQYCFQNGAQIGPTTWYWDSRKFESEEAARLSVGEMVVAKILGEIR